MPTQAMIRSLAAAALAVLAGACASGASDKPAAQSAAAGDLFADSLWRLDSVTQGNTSSILHLRNGQELEVPLFAVTLVGMIPRPGTAPLLVLGAEDCSDCEGNKALYVLPADADSVPDSLRAYAYPGTLRPSASQSDDTTPVFRARVFLGNCLDPAQTEVVWYQSDKDSLSQVWRSRVFHVVASGDSAMGESVQPRPPIDSTLGLVQAGRCRELPGIDQVKP